MGNCSREPIAVAHFETQRALRDIAKISAFRLLDLYSWPSRETKNGYLRLVEDRKLAKQFRNC